MPTDLKSILELVNLHPQGLRNYWAEKAKNLIDENYSQINSVHQVSDSLHISTSHLRREFFKEFGLYPKRYIMRIKVYHACELLERSQLIISEIIRTIAIHDRKALERSFNKTFGVSPSFLRLSVKVTKNSER